jgi:hypothetical protein
MVVVPTSKGGPPLCINDVALHNLEQRRYVVGPFTWHDEGTVQLIWSLRNRHASRLWSTSLSFCCKYIHHNIIVFYICGSQQLDTIDVTFLFTHAKPTKNLRREAVDHAPFGHLFVDCRWWKEHANAFNTLCEKCSNVTLTHEDSDKLSSI